MELKKQKNK